MQGFSSSPCAAADATKRKTPKRIVVVVVPEEISRADAIFDAV
jgi:hypothetical protein